MRERDFDLTPPGCGPISGMDRRAPDVHDRGVKSVEHTFLFVCPARSVISLTMLPCLRSCPELFMIMFVTQGFSWVVNNMYACCFSMNQDKKQEVVCNNCREAIFESANPTLCASCTVLSATSFHAVSHLAKVHVRATIMPCRLA
jgi:hypothetical protein